MTEGKIKKILEENIFKDIKTVEDANEYINIFDKQVKPLLNEKIAEIEAIEREKRKAIIEKDIQPYLKFTKEVAKYLESKNYKEGKDYIKEEDIINNMSDYGYPRHIQFFKLEGYEPMLESNFYNNSISYYFAIYTDDENIKIKIKNLKPKIENDIFDKFVENSGWILYYEIDLQKDNPQKIAQAMIDLYELLKKEIK